MRKRLATMGKKNSPLTGRDLHQNQDPGEAAISCHSDGYIIFIILNYSHGKRNISYDTMQPGEKLSACLLFS